MSVKRKGKVGRFILMVFVGIIIVCAASALIFGGVILAGKLIKSFAPADYKFTIKEKGMLLGGSGQTLNINYEITPTKDAIENEIYPSFSSLNERVATVTSKGAVTAGDELGETTVTAVLGETKYELKIKNYDKWVALTYDDGPGPYTQELLGYLRENNAKATFFLVGQNILGNEKIVKEEFDDGNEIANHTYSHNYNIADNYKAYTDEVKRTDNLIQGIIGKGRKIFLRPPGGFINDKVTRKQKKPIIMWSLDTLDWQVKNEDKIFNYVRDNVYSGAIILMHDIHPKTVKASKRVIEYLKNEGYYFATIHELLLYPDDGESYNQGFDEVRSQYIY